MITLKVETGHVKQDGTLPLYLRITQNRKHNRMPLGIYVTKSNFNPKGLYEKRNWIRNSHLDSGLLNDLIAEKYEQVTKARVDLKQDAHRDSIANAVQAKDKAEDNGSFLAFADEYVESFKDRNEYNTYRGKKSSLHKFKTFLQGKRIKELRFSEVNLDLIKNFERYLIKLGNNPNTVEKELSRIRAILNEAVKYDKLPMDKNPFLRLKLQRKKSEKIRLSEEEVLLLATVQLPENSLLYNVRNAYLFSFFSAGMRCGDLLQLRWSNITDEGRLIYQMNKTSLPISIKLPPQALKMLDHYRSQYNGKRVPKTDFIFPFFDNRKDYSDNWFLKKEISAKNALLNKYLKKVSELAEVGKPISMHTARHTFADLGRRKTKDVYAISKALGHTKIQVTQQYLSSFDTETVDNALEAIFS
jgi:integrase